MLSLFIACILLGLLVGFLAGLFGIGGGLIIVPSLSYLFYLIDLPSELVMSMALGTSFSTIVITSFSSAYSHHKRGNVDTNVAKYLVPSVMVAVFIAGLISGKLPSHVMSKVFAVMVVYLALKMLFSLKNSDTPKPLTPKGIVTAGGVIGTLSSFAGIGGGAFVVPYLNARGVDMKRSIGTSALSGAFLGLSGTLSFIVGGWNAPNLPEWSLGYVYLPALVGITATSIFTAKLGAYAAHRLPVPILKKAFAVMLLIIAANMFMK